MGGTDGDRPPGEVAPATLACAVADHGTAREVMSDEVLARSARDLVVQVRKNLKKD
ncbi:hypothetical protein [Microbispora bryophytorum]|uniref:hypothetical protein n=1 Tax=Microbispora bryophytorum TaxID=1460882 RepID=UPI0033FE1EB6